MRSFLSLVGCLLILAATTQTVMAQSGAVIIFVNGGRHFPLNDLSDAGDDFGPAFSFGGGLGFQLSPNVAFRVSASRVQTEYRGSTLTVTDQNFTRVFYAGDLQIGWPTESGWAPYLFGGAGVVSENPKDASLDSFIAFGVRLGTGVNYVFGRNALFLEILGWLYRFDELGFNKMQLDLVVQTGIAFALPF